MTEHLISLADEGKVRIYWTTKGWKHSEALVEYEMDKETRSGWALVIIPVIKRPSDYLFGLHELGHALDENALRFTFAKDQYEEVLGESAAWAWAAEHILPKFRRHVRAKDWDRVGYAWRTYLAGRHWSRKRQRFVRRNLADRLADASPRGSVSLRATLRATSLVTTITPETPQPPWP